MAAKTFEQVLDEVRGKPILVATGAFRHVESAGPSVNASPQFP